MWRLPFEGGPKYGRISNQSAVTRPQEFGCVATRSHDPEELSEKPDLGMVLVGSQEFR